MNILRNNCRGSVLALGGSWKEPPWSVNTAVASTNRPESATPVIHRDHRELSSPSSAFSNQQRQPLRASARLAKIHRVHRDLVGSTRRRPPFNRLRPPRVDGSPVSLGDLLSRSDIIKDEPGEPDSRVPTIVHRFRALDDRALFGPSFRQRLRSVCFSRRGTQGHELRRDFSGPPFKASK
ncbi:L-seryl-tRNA(Sec) selenium transferase [Striga asiatica]|uniref:L-seryl-tRNA(Sec) selenium transferase n=1 Tax=Striga asiatica TaxID=4170 RepID=A0A5A7PEG6_STRAF|nr:L-seryl-tRNA(Sec) selenium transferase [Striga asiatica]